MQTNLFQLGVHRCADEPPATLVGGSAPTQSCRAKPRKPLWLEGKILNDLPSILGVDCLKSLKLAHTILLRASGPKGWWNIILFTVCYVAFCFSRTLPTTPAFSLDFPKVIDFSAFNSLLTGFTQGRPLFLVRRGLSRFLWASSTFHVLTVQGTPAYLITKCKKQPRPLPPTKLSPCLSLQSPWLFFIH